MRETAAVAGDCATCMGSTDCERLRPGPVAQPVNTLTSLAFVAAAGAVAAEQRAALADRGPEVVGYAALLALVGAGSVAFHGPQPPGAQQMHDWPIAALVALTVATPVVRAVRGRPALPGWNRRRGAALAVVGAAAGAAYWAGRTSSPTCRPDSLIQGHGAWHVLAAGAFAVAGRILYDDGPGA